MKNLIFCDLHAGHYFLSLLHPFWLYMLFFFGGYLLLMGGRWVFEGRPYNVARSADVGDFALTAFVTLAANVIQRPSFHPASWMESGAFHWIVVCTSILVIIYFLLQKPRYTMDVFHAVILAPLLFYFIVITAPIYWCYASWTEKIIGLFLLLIWVALVIYDTKADRMDQRRWIARHKPHWRF